MSAGISLLNAKLDYALRAVIDLAMQPPTEAVQSREIAARQRIPGPYLDQILAELKRAGIVRSVRGAGGGYLLNKSAYALCVGDIVRTFSGSELFEEDEETISGFDSSVAPIVNGFKCKMENAVAHLLVNTSIADLVDEKLRYDDAHSMMPHM